MAKAATKGKGKAKSKTKDVKVKFDISDVKFGSSAAFEDAPKGVYRGKLLKNEFYHKDDAKLPTSIKVEIELTHDRKGKKLKTKYGHLWRYVGLGEGAEQILAGYLEAVGYSTSGKKNRKGTLTPKELKKFDGKMVLVRVKDEAQEDGTTRPSVGGLYPIPKDEDIEEDEDEDDIDEDEDEESDDEDDDESEDDEDDEEDDDDDEDEEDDEEDDDEDEDDDDDEEPPYEEWELEDLRKEAVSRKLLKKAEAAKKKTATLIRLLEEDDEEDGDDDDDESPF